MIVRTINNGYTEHTSTIGFIHQDELADLRTDVTIGSVVRIIETGEHYVLDNSRTWCLFAAGAGGGGIGGQSDWTETNEQSGAYIKHKPDLNLYRLISDSYSKQEVDNLISALNSFNLAVVEQLPQTDISTSTIYLVLVDGSENVYNQWVYVDNQWVNIGTTETDLSDYIPNNGNSLAEEDFSLTRENTQLFAENTVIGQGPSGSRIVVDSDVNINGDSVSIAGQNIREIGETVYLNGNGSTVNITDDDITIQANTSSAGDIKLKTASNAKSYYIKGNAQTTADKEIATVGDLTSALGDYVTKANLTDKSISNIIIKNAGENKEISITGDTIQGNGSGVIVDFNSITIGADQVENVGLEISDSGITDNTGAGTITGFNSISATSFIENGTPLKDKYVPNTGNEQNSSFTLSRRKITLNSSLMSNINAPTINISAHNENTGDGYVYISAGGDIGDAHIDIEEEDGSITIGTGLSTEDPSVGGDGVLAAATLDNKWYYFKNDGHGGSTPKIPENEIATVGSVASSLAGYIPNAGNTVAGNFQVKRKDGYVNLVAANSSAQDLGYLSIAKSGNIIIKGLDSTLFPKQATPIGGTLHHSKLYYGTEVSANTEVATKGDIQNAVDGLATQSYVNTQISTTVNNLGDSYIPNAGNTKAIDFELKRNKTNIASTTGGTYISAAGAVTYIDEEDYERNSPYNVVLSSTPAADFSLDDSNFIGVGETIRIAVNGTTGMSFKKDTNQRTVYTGFFNGGYHKPVVTLSETYYTQNKLKELPINSIYRINITQDITLDGHADIEIPDNMEIEFYSQLPTCTISGSVDSVFATIGNQAKVKFTNLNFYGMGTIANIDLSAHVTFENCTFSGIDVTVCEDVSNGMLIIRDCLFDDSFIDITASGEGHYAITNNYFDDDSSINIAKSSDAGTDPYVLVMNNRCNSVTIVAGITQKYTYNNAV